MNAIAKCHNLYAVETITSEKLAIALNAALEKFKNVDAEQRTSDGTNKYVKFICVK